MHGSLKGRLLLSLSAGLILTLAVAFFGLHSLIRNELYAQLDTDLRAHVDSLLEFAVDNPGRENTAEFDPEFRAKAHEDFFQIWDGSGRVVARSDSSAGRDLPRPQDSPGQSAAAYDLTLPDGHRGRALARFTALPPGDPRASLTIILAKETESLERLETRVHRWLALIALAVVLAAFMVVRRSINRSLETVDDLANLAARIDPEAPRMESAIEALPIELRPVASKLSALLEGLLSALERERRFARNVAHELRNPLAEARMLADVSSQATTLDQAHESMRELSITISELEQIVESLLAMARYEAGRETPQPEPIDLVAEVRRQLALIELGAKLRHLEIRADLPREFWVLSDSALLKRLIANLIANAVAHAPEGSRVDVWLSDRGVLNTANDAPHLSQDEVAKLGERFFRIDSGDGRTHAGLGLSLAQAVARLLAVRLELRLDNGQRLIATVSGFQGLDD